MSGHGVGLPQPSIFLPVEGSGHSKLGEHQMRKLALVLVTAATLGVSTVAAPAPAEARGGFGAGLAGGLVAGAVIGGLASSAWGYGYGPGYGYYGPGYGYYGHGYGPAYYSYAPAYYGYGPYYRSYAYFGGPRFYGRWHRRWRRW
jgi:hypothetical protein